MNRRTALGLALAALALPFAGPPLPVVLAADPAPGGARQVVAFYFHGKVRCSTCRGMEAMTAEVLKTHFAARLADHSLAWQVVNYDEADNRHFIEEYALVGPAVVLVEMEGGRAIRHHGLDKIWQLAHEEDEFKQYVRTQVAAFLKQG